MSARLTPLDASFLRAETPNAHMHVAWSGLLTPHPVRPRPCVEALRAKVAGRLRHVPRFRQRLAFAPLRFGEPFWIDDPGFDVSSHVTALSDPDDAVTLSRFGELTDAVLSEPLDRTRPLWHIYLVPRLESDRIGVVCKMHHAMVDGKSAVELALLLFDSSDDVASEPPDEWSPAPTPGGTRLALNALLGGATEPLRAARGAARLAGSPGTGGLTGTLRRAALAVEQDLLRSAPPSYLNVPIGPRRTLVRHSAGMAEVLDAKRRAQVTVNDVCLAAVAGALRELALLHGRRPEPLKVMVPVSVRDDAQRSDLGNRISFAFVDLPVHLRSHASRLRRIHEATTEFKRSQRPAGTEAVLGAVGLLPEPLKDRATRAASSARVFNLAVSNIPGPRAPLYVLGAELTEAYPVVPLAEDHALSIGMFSYRDRLFFGLYADPEALPEVRDLPAALNAAMIALLPRRRHRRGPPAGHVSRSRVAEHESR